MRSEQSKQHQRQFKKKEYWWYRRHGICVYCHQKDAVPGMQACADCFYKRQMRKIAKSSDEERAKQAEQRRQWRARHKAEGLCSECNQPSIDGFSRCKKHAMLHRMYDRQSSVHIIPDLTKCSLVACNEPAVPGKRFCEKHYKKKCAVIIGNQPKSNANHIWRRLDSAMFKGRRKRNGTSENG